ncbi:MAG: YkgJ family cysteine cluster protein [Gammaproteobacteria bacterium]|nr:YkgJ family cysteine cluster protein [Gammaproteobacteria bacterium]MDP2347818.1 YkgJ family cysteine cluster protein [Gammaproteobacteria bacterium]
MAPTESPFTEITEREYALTSADIKVVGWQQALVASQERQDAMAGLIASTLSPGIACQAGCWYCCYLKVDVRSEEVLQIVEYVRVSFSPAQQQRLQDDVAENAKALQAMSGEQQLTANLKCPLLEDGKCSVYAVRPARCRTLHATDVAGCRKAWEEPTNLNIPHTLAPALLYTGEAHLKGARRAFTDAGHDGRVYELNAALAVALAKRPDISSA